MKNILGITQEFPYCVSVLDSENNPLEILDSFVLLEDAIDHAKNNPGSGVWLENYIKDKNICEYTLLWHPCGDCAEYPDCQRDRTNCPYAEGSAQSQGICPECGSDDVEYDSADFEGNSIMYPAKCLTCQTKFDECYDMVFIEHTNIIKGDE